MVSRLIAGQRAGDAIRAFPLQEDVTIVSGREAEQLVAAYARNVEVSAGSPVGSMAELQSNDIQPIKTGTVPKGRWKFTVDRDEDGRIVKLEVQPG